MANTLRIDDFDNNFSIINFLQRQQINNLQQ